MNLFIPKTAYIDPKSQNYEAGIRAKNYLESHGSKIINSRRVLIESENLQNAYAESKSTVLLTVTKKRKLDSCKPSADYQFSLSSSCPATCEYCYLQTTQGPTPYIKLFVNTEDIFSLIKKYIEDKKPEATTFECASITDPLAVEHICGTLKDTIEFFGKEPLGYLRLVSKFSNVDSLLNINHNKHTKIRFTINSNYVIENFEHNTSSLDERLGAVYKLSKAGYPLGFIIAPLMIYPGFEKEYEDLILKLKEALKGYTEKISFELIQHRFTKTAKELILARFPNTKLDLCEDNRKLKWGPYGKFKFVYKDEDSTKLKNYLIKLIDNNFSNYEIEYFT